ncbi:MAG: universal stress protein [Velocimicrobium sp.]
MVPIDDSGRNLNSLSLIKELYLPKNVEIHLIMVKENFYDFRSKEEFDEVRKDYKGFLEEVMHQLEEYQTVSYIAFGSAGSEILDYAQEIEANSIIMEKSFKKNWPLNVGSTTTYIVKNAKCIVMILPE